MKKWMPFLIIPVFVIGCGTLQVPYKEPLALQPVVPQKGEKVDVEQVIILVDSSLSMGKEEKFSTAKSIVESLVAGMPDGSYGTGLILFSGEETSVESMNSFNRSSLASIAKELPYLGGSTPLENSLAAAQDILSGKSGKAAVILLSDGLPTHTRRAMNAAENLVSSYQDEICLHTVQVGDSEKGKMFLQNVSKLSACGDFRKDDSINQASSMVEFIRHVFFGPAPIVEEVVEVVKEKDSDGDGVVDSKDECPGTPKGASVDARGCWIIPGVTFEFDKAVIREEFYDELDDVADVLRQNDDLRFYLDGHADSRGTEDYNMALSLRRANAVKDYLVRKGVDANQLDVRGFGETKPVKPNTTEENMAMNRRTELNLIQ